MNKPDNILKGHRQVGKKFIPPILQLKGLNEISYVNQILPEILWMGLIIEELGIKNGVDLCIQIATRAFELKKTKYNYNFAIASSYKYLDKNTKSELLVVLKKDKIFHQIKNILAPFFKLYDEFPMNFLNTTKPRISKKESIAQIKNCIIKHLNKYETPALIIQANITYFRLMNGSIKYFKGVDPPDFNSIILNPKSDEAKRSAGKIRMGALSEFSNPNSENDFKWSKGFWNQNYKLEQCYYYEKSDY